MIPEPAPAQRRLGDWVGDELVNELRASMSAASSLLEHLHSPEHTSEALWALCDLLATLSNIGQHLGWKQWGAVCDHARSLLPRCSTDEQLRDWVSSLFAYGADNEPGDDVLASCPVAIGILSVPEPGRDVTPSEDVVPEPSVMNDEIPDQESNPECLPVINENETDTLSKECLATPLLVFRASDELLALPAGRVSSVVRKSADDPSESGGGSGGLSDSSGIEQGESRESRAWATERGITDRFDVMVDTQSSSRVIPVQSCMGVHTVPIEPLPEPLLATGFAGVASIPGVGVALVCGEEEVQKLTR
jgi:hypothetical protein